MSLKIRHFYACTTAIILILPVLSLAQNRGYEVDTVQLGQQLFAENCAVCHGANGEGTVKEWHKRDVSGRFPPPPLNGTAHTWHHPLGALMHTIQNGTVDIGGNMPAWKGKLTEEESFAIIIWITSLWPDEIYRAWMQRNAQ